VCLFGQVWSFPVVAVAAVVVGSAGQSSETGHS